MRDVNKYIEVWEVCDGFLVDGMITDHTYFEVEPDEDGIIATFIVDHRYGRVNLELTPEDIENAEDYYEYGISVKVKGEEHTVVPLVQGVPSWA